MRCFRGPMTRLHPSRNLALAVVLLAGMAGFTWSALANRAPDDRKAATEIISQQTAGSSTPAASHALAEASDALERADQARSAGDTVNATHLEGLAREWAEMARDIARATNAEALADRNQQAAASASAQVRKTHAMIETLVARRARAQGELQQLHGASSASIPSAALSAARLRPRAPGSAPTQPAPKPGGNR